MGNATTVTVDIAPLLGAAELLYDGSFVAERYAAFGDFAVAHPDALDPTVLQIVTAAAAPDAHTLVRDGERVDGYRRQAAALFTDLSAIAGRRVTPAEATSGSP